ncbi:uncharacterized protein B0P05DRAFT_526528 [Gilbertella persicaria]|uniref:uncharacterized protein n=1 Tax=Gilbertella persicaria TaxID=101096 RepID=UPI00221FA5A8|nr:uncharacterized protein B0P05DRAFT_526528 [Gilbertella persicaria]KAI8091199.1 hypothetical protein B0P05DRAFT_526528 [Gilbertella persicaria]
MALKFETEQWQAACVAFDDRDYEASLKTFIGIADNAKIHFNIGLIFATVEDHDHALGAYAKAIAMDPYFAVAYFQQGVSHFVKGNMEAACMDFDQAYQKLRGNPIINYQQLGLSFRLYSCEVLFNRGICQLYLGKMDAGLTDLYHAQKSRMTEEHDVIDQAVKDRGKGYSVFSIPPLVIFRPSESRLRQLQGDMFAAVDQIPIKKKEVNNKSITRNNSVLLNDKYRKPQQSPLRTQGGPSSPLASSQPLPPQQSSLPPPQMMPSNSTSTTASKPPVERSRKDSSFGMYNHSDDSGSTMSFSSSSYRYRQDGRRVDSGFESSLEDRYSSSSSLAGGMGPGSRNSAKSFKGQYYSPPPVPPIPKQHEEDSMYGDFDQELEEVYGSLHEMTVQDREKDRIRNRLGNNKDDFGPQASTSTSTVGSNNSNGGRIKIKVHYTDTRILLVSTSITFEELKMRIIDKFGAPPSIRLQYKDEDNEMVLMIDDDDLFMARQLNKSTSDLEKIEIWCVNS